MKNISLLPPEIRVKEKKWVKQRLFIFVSVAVMAIVLVVYLSLLFMTATVRSQASSLERQRQDIEAQVDELEHYAEMQERAEEAEATLQLALGNSPPWDFLLTELGVSMPGEIWLSDINASFEGSDGDDEDNGAGEGEITIRGWGKRHEVVASWLQKIEELDGLYDVRCQFSTETAWDGNPAYQFEIQANLESGQPLEQMQEGGGLNELARN